MKTIFFAAALALLACGARDTPEEAVRRVLGELETAAEARDVGGLREHLSESYRDSRGNDRRTVLGVATAHFMQHQSVYLLTRVTELAIEGSDRARASVLVAMAGTPIDDPTALLGIRADLYRFDVALHDEDSHWRVTSAEWQPASAADFQ